MAIILFVAWLAGLALFELAGTAIRLLIVLSVVALILRMLWGGSARANLSTSSTESKLRRLPDTGRERHQPVAPGVQR